MSNNKKNNIEVEVRALVKNLDETAKNIIKSNGKYLGYYSIHDIYFCKKEIDDLIKVEMKEVGSYGLRVRKLINDQKTEITINTKVIIKEDDHNAWREHEVVVENFEDIFHILENTEFKAFFELKKVRHHYKLNDFDIFLEDISNFSSGIEIEKMANINNKEKVKRKYLHL